MKTHLKKHMQRPKNILITFARSFLTLELARLLHSAGHKIMVADSMMYQVSRFSNSICKNFLVPSPRFDPKGYLDSLKQIVEKEKIDLLIPIYEEITYLSHAKDQFPDFCQVFSPSFDLFHQLHNKWLFQCKLEELGIPHPATSLICDRSDLHNLKPKQPLALKACYSRASQKVKKVRPQDKLPVFPIDPHNPWIAQEWIDGDRYCTYSICQNGKVNALGIYPVHYAIDGNSCLTFEAIHHQGIHDWISTFVKKINFTGQIAFDFIQSATDKTIHAIECNPRATSGVLLFQDDDHLDSALFDTVPSTIFPKVGSRKQIATGMLLYGWRKEALPNNSLKTFVKDLLSTQDVILRRKDLKPFLFQPLILAGIWRNSFRYGVCIPDAFTYDHDWNGEPFVIP